MRLDEITSTEPQREHGDLSDLKASIQQFGLLEPLVVTPEGKLLAGRRRYQALTELHFETAPVRFAIPQNKYEEFLIALHENTCRKQLTWQEEAHCALQEKRLYEEAFPETKHGGNRKSSVHPAHLKPPRYTEAKASVDGVDDSTVRRQVELGEALIEHPELAEARTPTQARRLLRQITKAEVPPPEGKYRVLYADPPWSYNDQRTGLPGYATATDHYPAMTNEEIAALPIREIASGDSVLFLWATSPNIHDALHVAGAWGFEYKAMFVWDKIKHNYGHYNSVRHELLLICTRGSCTPDVPELIDSVVSVERSEHSEKPAYFRELIDKLYTRGNRIELFARGTLPDGWRGWGAEYEG